MIQNIKTLETTTQSKYCSLDSIKKGEIVKHDNKEYYAIKVPFNHPIYFITLYATDDKRQVQVPFRLSFNSKITNCEFEQGLRIKDNLKVRFDSKNTVASKDTIDLDLMTKIVHGSCNEMLLEFINLKERTLNFSRIDDPVILVLKQSIDRLNDTDFLLYALSYNVGCYHKDLKGLIFTP